MLNSFKLIFKIRLSGLNEILKTLYNAFLYHLNTYEYITFTIYPSLYIS